jgi:hypothetical protein
MAEENRTWRYRRMQAAFQFWGTKITRSMIAALPERHGLEPAPERSRRTTWMEFLNRHRELIFAADFFTIEA